MSSQNLGLGIIDASSTMVGHQMFHLYSEPLWLAQGIVTNGITCWMADYADEPKEEPPFVVEDSWQFEQCENEAAMLKDCQKAGVEGIVKYIAHEESFENDTSKKRPSPYAATSSSAAKCTKSGNNSAPVINMTQRKITSSAPRRSSPDFSSNDRAVAPRSVAIASADPPSLAFATNYQPNEEAITAALASPTHNLNRVHTRLVISRGIRVEEFDEFLNLLLAMRDAVRGYRSLVVQGKLLPTGQ
ncbi:hypothetical protein RUND412_010677 [Rhizina undulata]